MATRTCPLVVMVPHKTRQILLRTPRPRLSGLQSGLLRECFQDRLVIECQGQRARLIEREPTDLLYLGFLLWLPQVRHGLELFIGSASPRFFAALEAGWLIAGGAAIGMLGSALALFGRRL